MCVFKGGADARSLLVREVFLLRKEAVIIVT